MIKRITINAYQVGLVFEKGKLIDVLQQGTFWILGNKEVKTFEMKQSFVAPIELNILLQNEKLASLLEIVEVADNEIALYFTNGLFKEVLLTGRYAFWKGYMENAFIRADVSKVEITEKIAVAMFENVKVRPFVKKFQVANFEKGLLFVNGEFIKELVAGTYYFWNNAISIEIKNIDIRQQQMEISGQELLTKDKAALRINFFVRYQVVDTIKALVNNKESHKKVNTQSSFVFS